MRKLVNFFCSDLAQVYEGFLLFGGLEQTSVKLAEEVVRLVERRLSRVREFGVLLADRRPLGAFSGGPQPQPQVVRRREDPRVLRVQELTKASLPRTRPRLL